MYSVSRQDEINNFEKLSKLIKRLETLEGSASQVMHSFFNPSLSSFFARSERIKDKKVCVTSTCYSLLTIMLTNANVYDTILSHEDTCPTKYSNENNNTKKQNEHLISIPKVVGALINSQWREDDLFQVPLLLYTLLSVDNQSILQSAANNPNTSRQIRKLLDVVLNNCPRRYYEGLREQHSDYISYQICKVNALLQESNEALMSNADRSEFNGAAREIHDRKRNQNITSEKFNFGGLPPGVLHDDIGPRVFWALLRNSELSLNEICRQLAYRTAGDSHSFDVIRLVYSLLTYIRSTESLSGLAGHELTPGEGASPATRVAPLNKRLVKAALAAFFEEQNQDGLWDKGQPIYKSFKKGKGRSMGNAFVFPVNTVGSLLCALPAESFRPHLAEMERTLEWIESHQSVEIVTTQVDAKTGQCHGKPLIGWSSPHHDKDSGPQAWPTAQVLKCVSWMKLTIEQLMHNDVLEEFNGIRFSDKGKQTKCWDRLLDSDLGDPSKGNGRTIKSVLEERVVVPFSSSMDNPSYGAAYSAILFGPPGTAKTSICEALAQRMGYDFCVIDTSLFLADGLSNVSARIRYIFRRLMALKKTIILFDEIEEFCLDRENQGLSMESRMLTTAMLTAINDLRRKSQSVFFIATNRLKAFDSAITRRGRFDMKLFVGTPNLKSRIKQLEQKLFSQSEEIKVKAINEFRHFLESVWFEDAMFMNYLEGMQFATACANVVLSNKALSKKTMADIFKQQAAVMTGRGSARDEYISSMELSRM